MTIVTVRLPSIPLSSESSMPATAKRKDAIPYGINMARTSLLIRLSPEDAARIREGACSEYRSVSGYLLYALDRSFRIEEVVVRDAIAPLISKQARAIIGPQNKKSRTAVHLRCTVEQAARIRKYAAKRQLSISDFVIFSLRRPWIAVEKFQKS